VLKNFFVVETDTEFFFGGPFEAREQLVSPVVGGIGESRQRFTGGIIFGEDPSGSKSREAFDGGAVLVVGIGFLAVDAGSEDGNAFSAFDDVAAEFAPGVESGDSGSRGVLRTTFTLPTNRRRVRSITDSTRTSAKKSSSSAGLRTWRGTTFRFNFLTVRGSSCRIGCWMSMPASTYKSVIAPVSPLRR
jgi:hypothetical protein